MLFNHKTCNFTCVNGAYLLCDFHLAFKLATHSNNCFVCRTFYTTIQVTYRMSKAELFVLLFCIQPMFYLVDFYVACTFVLQCCFVQLQRIMPLDIKTMRLVINFAWNEN